MNRRWLLHGLQAACWHAGRRRPHVDSGSEVAMMMGALGRSVLLGAVLFGAVLLAACGGESTERSTGAAPAVTQSGTRITLTSGAFAANAPIPTRFTCDGDNVSPSLSWRDTPAKAAGFALIMD